MLDISQINPFIRVAMHSVIPAKFEIKRRIIFDYELIFIEDGEFVLNYDGTDYTCQKGQFILLRPNVPHSFKNIDRDLSQPHVHFDITHLENSPTVPVSFKDFPAMSAEERKWIRKDVFAAFPKTPFVTFKKKKTALKYFYKAIDNFEDSHLLSKTFLMHVIEMLISDNFPNLLLQTSEAYLVENQVKDFIDAGQGMGASLDDIARQFNYSKYYLERRFKKRYQVSIMAYRNQKRMQTAKELLKQNSVSATSEILGFSSIYSFSRTFKNYFGFPPTSIKK